MKPGEFVGMLFLARDAAHASHLTTDSFAKHMALGEFYEGIVPLADQFAEAWQGAHGRIGSIRVPSMNGSPDIISLLQSHLKEIDDCRYELAKREETALQNLVDEVVSLYQTTLYKLKFLA